MRSYLGAFDPRIVGLGGEMASVRRFSAAAGAGFEANESGSDHSTSIFVLDVSGRPVATLLRPSDPKRIVADLLKLRASHDPALAQGH
jgi:cytochrome oxidase Cu insertion factor (SCO1/SenC/PrrC family)